MSSSTQRKQAVRGSSLDITPTSLSCPARQPRLEYFAGLFDGEGSVSIGWNYTSAGHPRHQLYASVHMCDREPLEALRKRWGGGIYDGTKDKEGRRDTFHWAVCSGQAAVFLAEIQPYLLIERVFNKVGLALEFQAQKAKRGGPGRYAAADYRVLQRSYYDAMRELNRRGQ